MRDRLSRRAPLLTCSCLALLAATGLARGRLLAEEAKAVSPPRPRPPAPDARDHDPQPRGRGHPTGSRAGAVVSAPPLHHRDGERPHVGQDPLWPLDEPRPPRLDAVATVRESSGELRKDPRAALWSPLPVWDRRGPLEPLLRRLPVDADDGTRFLLNHAGEIWRRAVSKTPGPEGIRGPFEDVGVVMKPGPDSLPGRGCRAPTPSSPAGGEPLARLLRQRARTENEADRPAARSARREAVARRPVAALEAEPGPDRVRFHREPDRDRGAWPRVAGRLRRRDAGRHRRAWSRTASAGQGQEARPPAEGRQWAKEMRTRSAWCRGGDRFTLFYTGFEQPPDWTRASSRPRRAARPARSGSSSLKLER
jgi:hypothetical protein